MEDSKNDEIFAQYRECYESLRQHDRFIWQVPAAAATISGGLVAFAFSQVEDQIARGVIIAIAAVLTLALLIAVVKHRYFSAIEQESLSEIEDSWGVKRIQRTTTEPKDTKRKVEFWYAQVPASFPVRSKLLPKKLVRCLAKKSAGEWLILAMLGLFLLLIALFCLNLFIDPVTN